MALHFSVAALEMPSELWKSSSLKNHFQLRILESVNNQGNVGTDIVRDIFGFKNSTSHVPLLRRPLEVKQEREHGIKKINFNPEKKSLEIRWREIPEWQPWSRWQGRRIVQIRTGSLRGWVWRTWPQPRLGDHLFNLMKLLGHVFHSHKLLN